MKPSKRICPIIPGFKFVIHMNVDVDMFFLWGNCSDGVTVESKLLQHHSTTYFIGRVDSWMFFSTSIQPLLNGVQVAGRTGSQGHFLGSPKMEVQLFIGFCLDNFHGTFLSIVQGLWSFGDLS